MPSVSRRDWAASRILRRRPGPTTYLALTSEINVLVHAQCIDQRLLLDHHGDSEFAESARVAEFDVSSVYVEAAGIGTYRSRQNTDQR
ncbi:hypothetical protein QV65_02570 [Rhodococcus erythropolis]|nr:hypothetical protein QV65_02570 [Rhodococcus erythropolis]